MRCRERRGALHRSHRADVRAPTTRCLTGPTHTMPHPYVGPHIDRLPKIWYFLLDTGHASWHERGTAATLPRTARGSLVRRVGWWAGTGARGGGGSVERTSRRRSSRR